MTRGIEAALWGSATRDAEIRKSKAGNAFGIISLMTQDGSTDADGKPVTTFVKVLAFSQHVNAARQIRKADRVYCEGSLSASIWRTADGEPRIDITLKAFRLEKTAIGKSRPPKNAQRIDSQAPLDQLKTPEFNDALDF